jgi:hypothetical protein
MHLDGRDAPRGGSLYVAWYVVYFYCLGCILIVHAIVKNDSHNKWRNRRIISTSKVDEGFESSYLQVHAKGKVTAEDMELNNIDDGYGWHDVPAFVREHEKMLSQKRKVSDEVRCCLYLIMFQLLIQITRSDACNC